MSRLSIEIDPEQHRQIKTLASFAGMTVKDYILLKAIPLRKPSQDETEYLLSSPENARVLRESLKTPRSEYVEFGSLEELKNALGL